MGIDLSKQEAVDGDPKAIHQINFTGSLDRVVNTTMSFIIEEAKENISYSSQGTMTALWIYFYFNIISV